MYLYKHIDNKAKKIIKLISKFPTVYQYMIYGFILTFMLGEFVLLILHCISSDLHYFNGMYHSIESIPLTGFKAWIIFFGLLKYPRFTVCMLYTYYALPLGWLDVMCVLLYPVLFMVELSQLLYRYIHWESASFILFFAILRWIIHGSIVYIIAKRCIELIRTQSKKIKNPYNQFFAQ